MTFKKGMVPWNKGKNGTKNKFLAELNRKRRGIPRSEEIKNKISKTKKGIPNLSVRGSKNRHWKGGITPVNLLIRGSIEYKLWRNSVFERDKFTCVWCGQVRGDIEADHIKPFAKYPELRFAIDNGRTLCHSCHTKTDTYRGKSNKKHAK